MTQFIQHIKPLDRTTRFARNRQRRQLQRRCGQRRPPELQQPACELLQRPLRLKLREQRSEIPGLRQGMTPLSHQAQVRSPAVTPVGTQQGPAPAAPNGAAERAARLPHVPHTASAEAPHRPGSRNKDSGRIPPTLRDATLAQTLTLYDTLTLDT